MRLIPFVACAVTLVAGWCAGHLHAEEGADVRPKFESYQVVFLRRSTKAVDVPREQRAEIGRQHLGHLRAMAKAGHMVLAGPFGEKDDSDMRGMCLYRVPSIKDARDLASQDPAVAAGLLEVQCATWYVEKGYVQFPKAVAPASTGVGVDQSSPKALAEAIFEAARSGKLDALAGIASPGSDGDSKRVAGVAKAPAQTQAEFRAYFSTGKIAGEITIEGNTASVPITFGPDGTKPETFRMVRQADGKWYLESF